jgi:hypothetical protein
MQPLDLSPVFGMNTKVNTMKSVYVIALLLFFSISTFAQQSEERDVGAFSEIKVGEAIDLYLIQGSAEKLRIEADADDIDDVETRVSAGTLKIGMKPGNYRHSVKVYVTYRKIDGITATSASNVYSEGVLRADKLELSVSSAASAELEVDADQLNISASSSGDVEISGKANRAQVKVSSAGDVDAYDLVVNEMSVTASSAGDAKVFVKNSIQAHASSGGSVRYRGNPSQSQTDSSSGGSVRKTGD